MKPQNNDFHLNRPCQITDVNCWKNQFKHSLDCRKNDYECWRKLVPKLPCDMNDIECWKKEYPDIPCEFHDKECWKGLLPSQLPCKIDDKLCWDTYRGQLTGLKGPSELMINKQEENNNLTRYFDPFSEYGFGMI